jgi:hypothetical protein
MLQEELLEKMKNQTIENLQRTSNEGLLTMLYRYTIMSHQDSTYDFQRVEIDCAVDICDAI